MKKTIKAIHSQINNMSKKSPRNDSSKIFGQNNRLNITKDKIIEVVTAKKSFVNDTQIEKQPVQENKQVLENVLLKEKL